MLISNSRRFVFVHIHKAAGTSITVALDQTLAWNDLVLGGTPFGQQAWTFYAHRFGLNKHSTAAQIRDVIGSDLWNAYFTFTFVRHPYSRAVSLYTFAERAAGSRPRQYVRRLLPKRRPRSWSWPVTQAFLQTRSFSEFIRHEDLWRDHGARPQGEWITDDEGRIIVDFIGKVETLEEDFATVAGKIGLPVPEVGVHNRSSSEGWSAYLSDERDYQYLYERYRKDFEVLGYDPDLRG